jgi:large subunit ribosomal protein L29
MKASELRELSIDELVSKGTELRDELFNAGVRHGTGQLESTARLERLRRDIARVETVLGEKGRANDE